MSRKRPAAGGESCKQDSFSTEIKIKHRRIPGVHWYKRGRKDCMQILGYVIGFILILAVIFIPICLVAFGVPFLLILLFRLLRGILYCFLDLFTKKKRIPGYWNRNFGRESLKNLAGKCCYWAFLIITFFFDSDDDGGSSDSGSSGGGGSFGGGGAGRSF